MDWGGGCKGYIGRKLQLRKALRNYIKSTGRLKFAKNKHSPQANQK